MKKLFSKKSIALLSLLGAFAFSTIGHTEENKAKTEAEAKAEEKAKAEAEAKEKAEEKARLCKNLTYEVELFTKQLKEAKTALSKAKTVLSQCLKDKNEQGTVGKLLNEKDCSAEEDEVARLNSVVAEGETLLNTVKASKKEACN